MTNQSYAMALITSQISCERIIEIAKQFSKNLSCPLDVLTVQPMKADAKKRSKDMITLTTLARNSKVNIRIVYSDNPTKAIMKEISKINPIHIFMGQSGENSNIESESFAPFAVPVSVISNDKIIYTMPAFRPALQY